MKRKLLIAIPMIFLCVFALVACKKEVGIPEDNAVKDIEEEEAVEQTGYLFGFSGINMENPYFITLEKATREAIEIDGNRMTTKDPKTDPSLQASQIKEMIDEGVDAIFLCPVDWEKITPSLQLLKEADIKIINIDTQVKEMEYVDAYVGSNNKEAGELCGADLIERSPDGGKIAILECPTQNSINDRITGFEEAISKAEKGFEVIAREDTEGTFDKALEAAKSILEQYPDITAIMCGNDQIAVGVKTAVNLAQLKDVIIYGVDGSPDIKKELKKPDSQVVGTAAQSPISMGKTAAEIAVSVLEGEEYEKETYEDIFMINKDNVDMYGVDGWQ